MNAMRWEIGSSDLITTVFSFRIADLGHMNPPECSTLYEAPRDGIYIVYL